MVFKASKPEARVMIIQMIIASFLEFYLHSEYAMAALFLAVDFLFLFWYGYKTFLKQILIYAVMYGLIWGLIMVDAPIISAAFPFFFMMLIRVYPIYLLLKLFLNKVPVDELLFILDRLHVPKSISIPLMIMYRYVPTIIQESHYINESLKMREIGLSFSNLNHFVNILGNYMVPLLSRSETISEELTMSSLCKGLSVSQKRTCCTDVRLTKEDYIYLLGMTVVACGLLFLNYLTL